MTPLPEARREGVIAIAREAGAAIMAIHGGGDVAVRAKPDASPVTAADLAAHRCIVAGLGRLTPDIPVLSEESAHTVALAERRAWSRFWLVDPLDGTREFLKGNGEFSVNIALVEDGVPVFGVVQAPVSDVVWHGAPGHGAFRREGRDERAIATRRPATPPLRIAASRSHLDARTTALLGRIGPHETIGLGSSLKFCLLAEGGLDAYPRLGPTSEWDTAAGQAVLEAAGGCVLDLRGRPFRYNQRDTLLNGDFVALGDPGLPWRRWTHGFADRPPHQDAPRTTVPDHDPMQRLLDIMARLRDPRGGCPWDLAQDFRTIAPYTIEEAYEVADAIDRGDMDDLRDELGDLLLQVVFHAQMASEAGAFAFADVARAISDKMERRHPHVFGDGGAEGPDAVRADWEAIKRAERAAAGETDASALAGISRGLPEWQRAVKLQDRAARVGFDWPGPAPVMAKLEEELAEVRDEFAAIAADPGDAEARDRLEAELGDLLFVAANLARHAKVDPGAALRRANHTFERRFRAMEAMAEADGVTLADLPLEAQDGYWQRAKRAERDSAA